MIAMRLSPRLLRAALLLPVSLLLGTGVGTAAKDSHAHEHAAVATDVPSAVRTGRWSDPATWPDGKVPGEGDAVTIARDADVVLDIDPPTLRSLTIDGTLRFADDRDIGLETEWIYVRGGALEIGSEASPHTRKATITLTDKIPGENVNTMGDRGIVMMGGTLSLHGDRENAWTKLSKTAEAGSSRIEVLDARGWRKGDEIVLASTDFDPRQAEKRTVAAIKGNAITLDRPLDYMHFGEITFGVDERGEVGLLTRNIRIEASDDAEKSYFGGHIMAMTGSRVFVSGVELSRMGQHLTLARYPMHWHLLGEGQGQYIQNSSIHDTYSRCVTIHGTNNVRVENNVTFNTVGHCFFLEDAVETGNQFVRNLGIQTKCHPTLPCEPTNLTLAHQNTKGQASKEILIPSDNTVSTFWITNPDNVYRDNVAAGSDQIGFWMAFPQHPTGAFAGTEISKTTWPGRTKLREFSGNTAHSNFDGLMLDRGPGPDGKFGIAGPNLTAYADPADPKSGLVVSVFDDFTGYKNRNGAVWGRGEMHLYTGLKLADNAIGFTHASGIPGIAPFTSRVVDSLFVGESGNIGNPRTPAEIAYGRSLPSASADFPIRGYEYYDFHHEVENTRFVNYQPNALRDAGALSYLLFTSFGMSPENSVKGLTFENAQPVSFPPVQRRWASDYGRSAAYRSAAFRDLDGSVGGIPGAYIVIDNGIASHEDACEIKTNWHAAICRGDIGRFSIAGNFSGFETGPITDPIILQRNGRRFEYTGDTTLGSGAELRVETARDKLLLSLTEMDDGSSVILELPGFAIATGAVETTSLAALRDARRTSYYSDKGTLWAKLVVDKAAGLTVSPGSNAPPGFGPTSLPVGAKLDVSRVSVVAKVAAN
jgi:cell migration-inducing and hyaluronan-binding protein